MEVGVVSGVMVMVMMVGVMDTQGQGVVYSRICVR